MRIRRFFAIGLAAATVYLGACRDESQPVAPSEPEQAVLQAPTLDLQQSPERVMPGRVLVRLMPEVAPGDLEQPYGVAFERMASNGAFAFFRGAAGNERALAARMGADARVAWAEPDYLREPTSIDPKLWAFRNPGGLFVRFTRGRNSGDPVTSYLSTADADEDNDPEGYGSGGAAVAVASIDTGVDFGHPEFKPGTLVAGWDYYDDDGDPTDTDDHGTHTTGTMVGQNVGIAGIAGAPVTVYVYRVCGPLGCPTSAIALAIEAAADHGVVAMNLSLGGSSLGQAEADAIDYAKARDALVIASAGNGGTGTVSCPACDPDAISVAASNWRDELTYYSNWGTGLDLTAPGGEMYSNTTPESGIYSSIRGGGYAYYQGTSMAAPQVTGTAAVVASKTGRRGADLRASLENSADDLGAAGYDTQFGHGRLNSYAAVAYSGSGGGGGGGGGGGDPQPATVTAAFGYACSGLTCTFDGRASSGTNLTWAWVFGDQTTASGAVVDHTYGDPGDYNVVLTVTGDGGSDTASTVIQCSTRGKNVRCK